MIFIHTRCDNKTLTRLLWPKVHKLRFVNCVNDPSAGSPTDTLLRLLVVPNGRVYLFFRPLLDSPEGSPDHSLLQATGGVYKRQGHNQRKLMTCTY
jgi:hypothetical protein